MPGTPTVELLRGIRAFEHAWWSLFASERDGNFLNQCYLIFDTSNKAYNRLQRTLAPESFRPIYACFIGWCRLVQIP
jgi:hypothetical protein